MAMHEDRTRYLMRDIKSYEYIEFANELLTRAGYNENTLLKKIILFQSVVLVLTLLALVNVS